VCVLLTGLSSTTAALRAHIGVVHHDGLRTPSFKLLKAAQVRMYALELDSMW
jgi:hypothetical protein